MRLRLTIKRHELPTVQILHGVHNADSTTISELVAQVNTIVPLESEEGQWGLEDYIVSVSGFECVHFAHVSDILKEDDQVEYVQCCASLLEKATNLVAGYVLLKQVMPARGD